jgi:hypothetical protein
MPRERWMTTSEIITLIKVDGVEPDVEVIESAVSHALQWGRDCEFRKFFEQHTTKGAGAELLMR